ncbi:MAG: GNAT family N-acetyltransferase [Chitinophagaceae bacterium]|nr:GNAT family N-acetyltransferase [Chitinophagaceae bacterium]
MALKILDHGSPEYLQMVKLRNEILRKPLGLVLNEEELLQEKNQILIGAFEDDVMLGCCMVVKESEQECRLRQMAVLNTLRGKGVGRAIMTFAENIARDRGYKRMVMHARSTALGFYEKLGYKTCGEEFIEITIPHYIMQKELTSREDLSF